MKANTKEYDQASVAERSRPSKVGEFRYNSSSSNQKNWYLVERVALCGFAKFGGVDIHAKIANEYVANRLAVMLNLPVPPGAIADGPCGRAFVTLAHESIGHLDSVDDLIADWPSLCAGIVAFDSFIHNVERHTGNIIYSRRMWNRLRPDLREPLPPIIVDNATGPPFDWRGTREHCARTLRKPVRGCIDSTRLRIEDLRSWSERISRLPRVAIEDTITSIVGTVIDADEADCALEYLLFRQERVMTLIEARLAWERAVPEWAAEVDRMSWPDI